MREAHEASPRADQPILGGSFDWQRNLRGSHHKLLVTMERASYCEAMGKDYGQFCGLAKASSALGERWSLLIVRDLSVAPRRLKDLHEGLPGIPTSVLKKRLSELKVAGCIDHVAINQQ